ncbi:MULTISPECIES: hypothetical protein [unclassified Chryseobacterium]|uniref:hypothetical protein n=1 Tax=unclassified Chryseobacterium TaxID=2593645 RepID=UPI0028532593|nr:hypothetical protein [Chryseobacterium sp. CFS7]MDR4892576.1 hypothetical protein [Chryseobacterium sp. CFS7]
MTHKEIRKAHLENNKLYDHKDINFQEYINKQFELLSELDRNIYRLENIHLELFKDVKTWFRKKFYNDI